MHLILFWGAVPYVSTRAQQTTGIRKGVMLWDDKKPLEEIFPPGTYVLRIDLPNQAGLDVSAVNKPMDYYTANQIFGLKLGDGCT